MSEVKVNKISPRTNCGTVTVGDSGDSVSVSAGVPVTVNGDLKSNALKATDGGSIISQSGTTITLGASGDTIQLASGASQSGFGRTGTVDWQTGSIKTATFTAVNGEGYFANTSGGAFTMNLPAGTAGNIVSVVDYTNTFQTNNLTVAPNGSQKIGGVNDNAVLSTEGQSVTFVYVDDTEGWKNVQDSTSNIIGNPYIVATGGTITTSGNCKIHTFTGPGTFTVCSAAACAANNAVGYLVVAGGGGGGGNVAAGGGAGGFREGRNNPITPYTASPLVAAGLTVTATSFPITVGAGGNGGIPGVNNGLAGSNSVFSTITSTGGGGGGSDGGCGQPGGSGGGRLRNNKGTGNSPPVSPPQGNPGGDGSACGAHAAGGGGGATAAGQTGTPSPTNGGNGGDGATTHIYGSPQSFAGGGGGSATVNTGQSSTGGNGGLGGGGGASFQGPNPTGMQGGAGFNPGANGNSGSNQQGAAGGTNSGGGGGGSAHPLPGNCGGTGGSGIVIIRYKFQ